LDFDCFPPNTVRCHSELVELFGLRPKSTRCNRVESRRDCAWISTAFRRTPLGVILSLSNFLGYALKARGVTEWNLGGTTLRMTRTKKSRAMRRRNIGRKGELMYYVYILADKNDAVMYIGVTNNLKRRLYEHKNEQIEGFTKKYHVHKLVYYEEYSEVNDAIAREKQLKRWVRAKKNWLVETKNPNWDDWGEGFI